MCAGVAYDGEGRLSAVKKEGGDSYTVIYPSDKAWPRQMVEKFSNASRETIAKYEITRNGEGLATGGSFKDVKGLTRAVIDAQGNLTEFILDEKGRRAVTLVNGIMSAKQIYGENNKIARRVAYDREGIKETVVKDYVYDEAGNLVRTIEDNLVEKKRQIIDVSRDAAGKVKTELKTEKI